MIDTQWNMKPNKAKALMLAKRQLAQMHAIAAKDEALEWGQFRSSSFMM